MICTFSRAQHATEPWSGIEARPPFGVIKIPLGGPKNTSEHSRMVQNGRVYPDHACVHEFLDFCNPYGVICTFYRSSMGQDAGIQMVVGDLEATL